MLDYLAQYGLFLAKTISLVVAIIIVLISIVAIATRGKEKTREKIEIKNLNKKYHDLATAIKKELYPKNLFKQYLKEDKKQQKIKRKSKDTDQTRKKIFVLNFSGDLRASNVNDLRETVTTVLLTANQQDEVVVILESPGGLVHSYGLAASQLARIRKQNIPLTVIVDKVAASGGYLMACVANKILAAPFAIIGSIGVLAQVPNFHRLLKENNIDFEQITAGEYKRTLTLFGENTEKARIKMKEDVEAIHTLFKDFIKQNRPDIDIDSVATGEYWLAAHAIELKLVDGLMTSDDYLISAVKEADVYHVDYKTKKSLVEKLGIGVMGLINNIKQIVI